MSGRAKARATGVLSPPSDELGDLSLLLAVPWSIPDADNGGLVIEGR